MANRPSNVLVTAAHPRVAGALASIAQNFADSAEPLIEHPVFIVIGLVAAIGLLIARAQGLIA
jgi:hypothetical protein